MPEIQEQRKKNTRAAIKTAALEIAGEEGWQNVTIRKIADKVLYAPPVVYEHFENKSDLFKHLVKDGFESLYRETIQKTELAQGSEEKIIKMAEARYDFATNNMVLHCMMFDSNNPEWGKKEIMNAMKRIKDLVFIWLEDISTDKEKVEGYFLNLIALIYGFTFMMKNIQPEDDIKEFFKSDIKLNMKQNYLSSVERFIKSIKN